MTAISASASPAPETPTPIRRRKGADDDLSSASDDAANPTPAKSEKAAARKLARRARVDDDDYSPWLDVARVLTFFLVASCGLSYLASGGETWFWYYGQAKPSWMRLDHWKAKMSQEGPLLLTLDELAAYDGTDESKPIYLAINGTIYDVSAGRRIYGPGGSYKYFAGCDASRAYVTGCFAEDRTADMRGVEDMYLPLDDIEINKLYTKEELTALRHAERRDARRKVHEALKHWVDFFAGSAKYHEVGKIKREKGWLKKEPRRKLCEQAEKGRVVRKAPEGK